MRPNCAPEERFEFGNPKFTLLKALNNSALNWTDFPWTDFRSEMEVFFTILKSVLKYLGPRRKFFPELPKVPSLFAVNTEVLKYCRIISP